MIETEFKVGEKVRYYNKYRKITHYTIVTGVSFWEPLDWQSTYYKVAGVDMPLDPEDLNHCTEEEITKYFI